jgi:hypothetical protein
MFLKITRPEPEQAVLEKQLKLLDNNNDGAEWMYLTSELARYNIQRIRLIEQIKFIDEYWVEPEKPV